MYAHRIKGWLIRPRIKILSSSEGENGFSFAFKWNQKRQPVKFNRVRIRLFNPYGSPTQVDVMKNFTAQDKPFKQDLNMGPGFKRLLNSQGLENSVVQIEVMSQESGMTHLFSMKGKVFKDKHIN